MNCTGLTQLRGSGEGMTMEGAATNEFELWQ